MKFSVLFIGVMILEGMELHRHINRHDHKGQMTGPQRETNELDEIDKAVDKQQPVDLTVVQKDLRSKPGNADENAVNADGPNMVQNKICDGNITPKPGIRKNQLVAKYGINFRYMEIVKNGLDRVMVVTSIPIQRFEDLEVKPINFAKCAKTLENNDKDARYLITADTQVSKAVKEWCAWAIPYIEYLQQQEKYYIDKVHECMCEDLYSALPVFKPTLGPLRKRWGIGNLILSAIPSLITLAVESVSSWIKGKQQKRVDEAVSAMRVEYQVNRNSQVNILNQAAQGPSKDASKKTESTLLSLLNLRVSPTPKIVNRLLEIKKKNTRGPSKRLTQKTLKDLTADPPLLPSQSVTASPSSDSLRCLCSAPPSITHLSIGHQPPFCVGTLQG